MLISLSRTTEDIVVSEELLHRMAYTAKDLGESVWIDDPSAVVQLLVWTEHGVDEVVVGYTGEKITAHISHEELESPETFLRLRSEIDDGAEDAEETDPE
jgi:hypothetical protein